jgi:hypothetical protein
MIQIRRNVFETNSSSTHSITICTKDEFKKWQNGELYFVKYEEVFVSREEVLKFIREDKWINGHYSTELKEMSNEELLEEFAVEVECFSWDKYWEDIYLESYEVEYTSPSGDELVVFGQYGYDG